MVRGFTQVSRFASLAVLSVMMLCGAANAQEITLKLHHFLPPMSPFHSKFMATWAERVTKQSNGRLKVQVYPSMQLGGTPPQIYDQIKDGVVDIGWTVAGYSAGRFPAFEVFELPFMVNSASGGSRALWEYVHLNKLDKTEFKDVKLLATHQHDKPHFHMVDKPIKTLADLKNALPKTWGSPTMSPHCDDEKKYGVVERITKQYQEASTKGQKIAGQKIRDLITVNGVRVVLEDGTWGLVRASSNKPELVIVVESPTAEANMRAIFADIDGRLGKFPEVGAYNQKI